MNQKKFFSTIGLYQAPVLTVGHRIIGLAALLGVFYVALHLVTVAVTGAVDGFNWGVNAWVLDILGFLASVFFAIQCWLSSNKNSEDFRKGNTWIFIWAIVTLAVRVIDTLMLLGVVTWSAVYITPGGVVQLSNIVSEVFFGVAFTVTALVGSLILLFFPQDKVSG